GERAFVILPCSITSLPTFPFLLTVEKKESPCLNIVVITSRGEPGFSR
ncbi:hypothetical protein GYM05_003962, partial [Shigella sonnei]|nr:hypothetical protein [Shigella sonnei]EFP9432010.1 hypothetical protein [Shigella sonnei]EFP9453571.1 hypothetical protein [Shigella sonnei]EFP9487410.1 hypothetical protein [Shigella sonnei]EFP9658104.1 hypothetical protein [Shigella sonnei]